MSITRKHQNSAISTLFSSTQAEVLGLLYGQPEREFMGTELIRQVGRGTGAVHRQLKQLTASGLLTVTKRANQTYYRADSRNPIFPELRGIFLKTTGLAEPLRKALAPFTGEIDAAFVYGSIASGMDRATSDIDLMVRSDTLTYVDIFEAVQSAERFLGRKVDPLVMSRDEWRRKLADPGSFVARVMAGPKLFVVGDLNDLA